MTLTDTANDSASGLPLSPCSRLVLWLSAASQVLSTAHAGLQGINCPWAPTVYPELIHRPLNTPSPEGRKLQPAGLEVDARISVSLLLPHQPKDTKSCFLRLPWGSGPASHMENRYQCVLRGSTIHCAPDYGSFFFPPTRKDLDYESSDEIEQYAVPMEPRPCQAAPARPRT